MGDVEVRDCTPCPVDCSMGQWSEWSACSTSCGTGVQTRTRPTNPAQFGGDDSCPQNGVVSECADDVAKGQGCSDACKYDMCDFTYVNPNRPFGTDRSGRAIYGNKHDDYEAALRDCSSDAGCRYVAKTTDGKWNIIRGEPTGYCCPARGANAGTWRKSASCSRDLCDPNCEAVQASDMDGDGTCNTKTRACVEDSGCVVDCEGQWNFDPRGCYINRYGTREIDCDTTRQNSAKRATYQVRTPAKNGGRACEASDGERRLFPCNESEYQRRRDDLGCNDVECCDYKGWGLHKRTIKGSYLTGSNRLTIAGKNRWNSFQEAKAACDSASKCKAIARKDLNYYALNTPITSSKTSPDSESNHRKYDYNFNKQTSCSNSKCGRKGRGAGSGNHDISTI